MQIFKQLTVVIVLVVMLVGCASQTAGSFDEGQTTPAPSPLTILDNVLPKKYPDTMKGWSFQYNEGTNDYSLFFELLDDKGNAMSTEADVDIRIVTENGEESYKDTAHISEENFDSYTSEAQGERYLANIRIPYSKVKPGTSLNGTVYFSVREGDTPWFDEVSCSAAYCLPVKDVTVQAADLPISINVKDYSGNVESVIQINEISYKYESDYSPRVSITVIGEKLKGPANSMYDVLSYKIYDHEGYVVESSHLYLKSISEGDKFKDDSIVMYSVIPGENYTIQFSEYEF